MATTTTNYGWDIPQSTDLVKDGATAIATLGQDIDTSIYTALGGNKSGMVHLSTVAFSGVSSQSVNDVFSTTYDNYRIYFQNLTNSSSGDIRLRWRVSGADNTTTNYKSAGQQNGTDNSTASVGQTSQTSIRIGYFTSGSNNFLTGIDVLNPFLTFPTGTFNSAFDGGGAGFSTVTTSLFNATTSFTGFTVFPASGNISGSVSVYGFNK